MNFNPILLMITLASVLVGCSARHEVVLPLDNPGLVREGKYLVYEGKPFSGITVEKFEILPRYSERNRGGKLKSLVTYENGLMEGLSQTWYDNGKLESSRGYHQGEKVGLHQGWWANGNPRFEYHFSNGNYDGSFKEWYENGKPLNFFVYDHGQEVSAIGWRENGKTYINFAVRNGRKYGLTNSRLCYSLKDEQGVYQSPNN